MEKINSDIQSLVAQIEEQESKIPVAVQETAGDGDGGGGNVSEDVMNALRKDWELDLENERNVFKSDLESLTIERDHLQSLLDAVMNETRTDIIKRLEVDLSNQRTTISSMNESLASQKTERAKLESRVAELTERTERAEADLQAQEERYAKNISEADERHQLAMQIAKQRDDIIQKSKAATSGWDAAANAEERLEIEVDRAFQAGLNEGRKIGQDNILSVNQAVEEKQARINEILEHNALLEKAVKDAELRASSVEKAASIATRKAAASVSNGGGGGDGGMNEETLEELQQAREALDSSQEECINLSEQLSVAKNELMICREEIDIYKRIIATAPTQSSQGATQSVRSEPTMTESAADSMITELQEITKKAIIDVSLSFDWQYL